MLIPPVPLHAPLVPFHARHSLELLAFRKAMRSSREPAIPMLLLSALIRGRWRNRIHFRCIGLVLYGFVGTCCQKPWLLYSKLARGSYTIQLPMKQFWEWGDMGSSPSDAGSSIYAKLGDSKDRNHGDFTGEGIWPACVACSQANEDGHI